MLRAPLEADDASDDALMARVGVRDSAAFRQLIDRHALRPHRIAYRMLGDGAEAEDVAQESMMRLWNHAARWEAGNAGVAAWLGRVATNLCLDKLRKRRFASDEAVPERADSAPLADVGIENEQQRRRTVAAIAALPDRQRAAIVLTYYEDMPNAAAALALDLNIKAFESLLVRARTALRASLGGDDR